MECPDCANNYKSLISQSELKIYLALLCHQFHWLLDSIDDHEVAETVCEMGNSMCIYLTTITDVLKSIQEYNQLQEWTGILVLFTYLSAETTGS